MTIERLILSAMPGERRLAAIENGRLAELVQVRADIESRIGEVRLGRVTKVAGGLDAAFVDVGLSRSGFLALAEARPPGTSGGTIADHVREGDTVAVQVIRDPIGDKGVKLTTRIDADLLQRVEGDGKLALAAVDDDEVRAFARRNCCTRRRTRFWRILSACLRTPRRRSPSTTESPPWN